MGGRALAWLALGLVAGFHLWEVWEVSGRPETMKFSEAPLTNEDRACFLVTKHSWKGKYKRIFSIGTQGLSACNPQTLEVTNQWAFGDVVWVKAGRQGTGGAGTAAQDDHSIHVRQKSGKPETMKFSSEGATELVSEALQQRSRFAEPRPTPRTLNGYKHHWSDARVAVVLQVAEAGLAQLSPAAPQAQPLALYQYRLIEELAPVSDYPGGFVVVYGPSKRLHLFACQGSDQLLPALNQAAFDNIGVGVRIRKQPITFAHFVRNRLGSCGSDAQVTSFIEFTVHKISPRHAHPQRRLLCLSESCVVERDPASYVVVTVRPLGSVACLVRCETNPQAFAIEYRDGARRDYTGTERDNVLASLVDGVWASGNLDVHVRMRGLEAGLRLGPASLAAEAEDEGLLCGHLVQAPALLGHRTAVRRFNTNIPYSGLRFSRPEPLALSSSCTGCSNPIKSVCYMFWRPIIAILIQAHQVNELIDYARLALSDVMMVPQIIDGIGNLTETDVVIAYKFVLRSRWGADLLRLLLSVAWLFILFCQLTSLPVSVST